MVCNRYVCVKLNIAKFLVCGLFLLVLASAVSATSFVSFITPTPKNGTWNSTQYFNVSLAVQNLSTVNMSYSLVGGSKYNTSFYDPTLKLYAGLNSNADIGETGTRVMDNSMSYRRGTMVGGPNSKVGRYSNALNFTWHTNYVNFTDSADFTLGPKFTVEAWIAPSDVVDGYKPVIGTYNGAGWIFALNSSSNNALWFYQGNTAYSCKDSRCYMTENNLWRHVAVVVSGTALRFYVNGVNVYNVTAAAFAGNGGEIQIGSGGTGWPIASYGFAGRIDEVKVFNRTLSSEEMKWEYYSSLNRYNRTRWYLQSKLWRDGNQTFTIVANSAAYNVDSSSRQVVQNGYAPFVSFVNLTTSAGTYNRTSLVANVTSGSSSYKNTRIYLYNKTQLYMSKLMNVSPSFYNFTGLPEGRYYINASSNDTTDKRNNTATVNYILSTTKLGVGFIVPTNNSYLPTASVLFNMSSNNNVTSCNMTIYGAGSCILSNWTFSGWSFRKMINLSSSVSVNNHPYLLNFSTFGLSKGKLKADCSDLRFGDRNNNPIRFMYVSGCNTTSTRVYLKLNLTATTIPIYVYYGNGGASSGSSSAVFPAGVIRYYPLGATTDVVGGYTLSVASGTPTSTTGRRGWSSESYYYGGAAWHSAASTDLPTGASARTTCAWIYYTGGADNNWHCIYGWGPGPGTMWAEWNMGRSSNSDGTGPNKLALSVYGGSYKTTTVSAAWKLVCAKYTGTRVNMWENGVFYDNVSVSLATTSASLLVGSEGSNSCANGRMVGYIEELSVYNTALNSAQMASLYVTSEPTVASVGSEISSNFYLMTVVNKDASSFAYKNVNLSGCSYKYSYICKGVFGGGSRTKNNTFTVDIVSPVVSYNAPTLANNTIYNGSTIRMNVSVTEANFVNSTTSIYYAGGLYARRVSTAKNYTANFTGLVDAGVYVVNTTAIDMVDRRGYQKSRSYTSDLTKPQIGFVIPTPNSMIGTVSALVNLTVSDANLAYVNFTWTNSTKSKNGTFNYANLVAALNFDRALTQNRTKALWSSRGVIGLWSMDEVSGVIVDRSGASTCVAHGNMSYGRTGEINKSIYFDGGGDYFNCSSASTQAIKARGTILMWVKPKTQSNSTYGLYAGCVGAGDAIYAPGYSLSKVGTNGNSVRFNLENTTSSYVQFDMQVPDLRWTFVAVTWDGTRVVGYTNATIINNVSQTANANSASCTMQVGGSNKITGGYSISDVDEVMVVNRALTPQEITAIYRETQYRDSGKLNGTYSGEFTTAAVSGMRGVHNEGFNTSYRQSNYVSAPWRVGLNSTNGTFCAWVKPMAFSVGTLFSVSDEGSQKSYLRVDLNSNGRILVYRVSNTSTGQVTTGTSKLTVGKWTYVCVSSYAGAWRIYYNGISQAINVTSGVNNGKWVGDVSSPDNIAFLGYRFQNSSQALSNVTVDDILLFNRSLKDDSVFSLYNSTFNLYNGGSVLTFYKNNLKGAVNYTYSALARDGAGNINTTETRWFVASQPVYVVFKKKAPIDIDTLDLFGQYKNVTITYNMTSLDGINGSSAQLEYKTNNSIYDGTVIINGTRSVGFVTTNINVRNVSSNFTFTATERNVYPAEYPIDPGLYYVNVPSFMNFTSLSSGYKVNFRFMRNDTRYNMFEFMAKNWTNYGLLYIIYCNRTYVAGQNWTTSSNCVQAGEIAAVDVVNHTHSQYNKHYLVSIVINITSGKIRTVDVTNMSYFIFVPESGNWSVSALSWVAQPNTNQYSVNQGLGWINNSYTINTHLHQYSGSETFWYRGCVKNNVGGRDCSSYGQDLLDLRGLVPSGFTFLSPVDGNRQSRLVNISHTDAQSPNDYAMANYTYYLIYTNFTQRAFIKYNNLSRQYIWNASAYNGTFQLKVRACDDQNQCILQYSEQFPLYNNSKPPVVHMISPSDGTVFGEVSVAVSCNASDEFSLDILGIKIYNGSEVIFRSNRTTGAVLFDSQTWNYNFTGTGRFNWTCFASDGRFVGNATEGMYQIVSDHTPPGISFIYPTPGNLSYINSTLMMINVSVTENISACYAQMSSFGRGGVDWFNSSWQVRKRFNVTSGIGTPRGYQLKIVLTDAIVGPFFDWSRNCADIRFANKTKGELSYWVKECDTINENATIWVKFDGNITSAVDYFYMYWGNSGAVTTSSARDTFFAYDQFENSTRMPGCSGQSEGYYYDEGNQWIRIVNYGTGVAGGYYCDNANELGVGYEVLYRQYTDGVGSNRGDGVGLHSWITNSGHSISASSGNGYSIADDDVNDLYRVYYNGTSLYSVGHYESSGWRDVKVRAFNGNFVRWTNGVLYLNWTDVGFASRRAKLGDYIGPYGGSGSWTNEYRIDDLTIRMYVSPEPVVVFGAGPEGVTKSNLSMSGVNDNANTYAFKGVFPSDSSLIYKVFCSDEVFNENVTKDMNVTIDRIPPVVGFVSPTISNGTYGVGNIYANVSTLDVNRNYTFVNIYKTGGGLINTTGGNSGVVWVSLAGLSDGYYDFNATGFDLAGNVGRLNKRSVILDVSAPGVNSIYPGEGASFGDRTQQYSCNATDAIALVNITLRIWNVSGGIVFNSGKSVSGGFAYASWNYTSPDYDNKIWGCIGGDQFRFGYGENRTVLFGDEVPPVPKQVSPANFTITNVTSREFTCNATDNVKLKNISLVVWDRFGNIISSRTMYMDNVTFNRTSWVYNFTTVGKFIWECRAGDAVNVGKSKNYTIYYNTGAPAVSFVDPTTASGYSRNDWISINVSASDPLLDTVDIKIFNGSGAIVNATVGYGEIIYVNRSGLTDGIYRFNATVNNSLGSKASTGTNFVILDTINPEISFTEGADNNGTVTRRYINANMSVYDLNLQRAYVRLYNMSGAIVANRSVYTTTNIRFNNLFQGRYFLNASAYDDAGRGNFTNTRNITVQLVGPDYRLIDPTLPDQSYSRLTSILANLTAYDSVVVNSTLWLWNATELVDSYYCDSSMPCFHNFSDLGNDIYYLNASGYNNLDQLGNSVTHQLRLSTVPPRVVINGPVSGNYTGSGFTFNMTIMGSAINRFNMSWDNKTYGVNYSFYDDGLVWGAGLDHNTAIGDTLTEVRDYSVYSNNGTITGATYTVGKYSNGMHFAVSGRKVKVGGVSVDIADGGKNTVELWFYRNHHDIQGDYGQTVPFGFSNMYALDWHSYHCFGFDSGVGSIVGFDAAGLEGGWHHIAAVFYNGISTPSNSKIYIDGVQRALTICDGGQTQAYKVAASTFWVGNVNDNAGLPWDGVIDEVRVWNKELGATQIMQDYYSNIRLYNETRMTFMSSQSIPDGNYTFRGYATSRYGLGNYSTIRVNIDTIRPISSFVAPITASGYRGDMWISANVSASDRNGVGDIVINLYNDSNSLVGASTSGSTPLFYNFTNLQNGIYKLNYTVSDSFGWKNIQSYRLMTLDNITPRGAFIFPSSSGNIYGYIPPINMTIDERNLNYTNYTVTRVGTYVKNYTIYDGSLVFMSSLDNNPAVGETGYVVVDTSRYRNNGTLYGSYITGRHGGAISGYVVVSGVNTNQQLGGNNTVDFWMYYGTDGWKFSYNNGYGIRKIGDCVGVSTDNNYDVMGVGGLASIYGNKWIHVVAVIPNGVTMPSNTRMFINGKLYPVSYCSGNNSLSKMASGTLIVGGSGYTDEFKIFNRGLSVVEALHENFTVLTKMNKTRWNLAVWDSPVSGSYVSGITTMDRVGLSNYSTVGYIVNRSPVSVEFVYPTTDSGNTTNNWLVANITASAPLGIRVIKLYVFNASNSLFNRTTVYNSTNMYVNMTNMPNGLFRFNVTANDTLDNMVNDTRRVVDIDLDGIMIVRTMPSVNNSYIRTSSVTLKINIGDDPSYCTVNWNGSVYTMGTYRHGNGSNATYYVSSLADSKYYTYSYQCQDYVGRMNTTKNYTLYVGYLMPVITIVSPVNNSRRVVTPVWINYSVVNYQQTWWGYEYQVPCGKHTCTRLNNYTYSGPVIYNAPDGANVLWFFANDTINNNASKRVGFDVDTVHPGVLYTYPTPYDGRVMSGNSTYVNVTVSESTSKCNLVMNGTNTTMAVKQSCIPGLPCVSYGQVNKSLTFDKTYTYHVWCNDSFGNGANSSVRTVMASSAMKLAYISKTDPDGLTSSKDYLQVNVSFSTQDLLNATLYVFKDGALYNKTVGIVDGYIGFNFTNLSYGVFVFNTTAYNAHRNRAVLPSHTVGLYDDSIPPVVHMVLPLAGASSSAMVRNFTCNITDDKAIYNVSFYLYNKFGVLLTRNTSIVSGTNNISNVSMVLPYEKGYNWTCKGSDVFNKVWAPEGLYVVYRDYQPPNLLYLEGTSGSYSNSRTITVFVNASDLTLNTVVVGVFNDSNYLLNTSKQSGSGGAFLFNVPVDSDGVFKFNVTANDSLNRVSKLYTLQTVIDTVKPNISWSGGTTENGTYTRKWIFANMTSSDEHKDHDTIWLYRGGVVYAQYTSYGTQHNFTNLPSGVYTLFGTVYDQAGNTNSTNSRNIILDVESPNFYFVAPTPESGSNSSSTSVAVNMTTVDPFQTYNLTIWKMGSGIVGSEIGTVLPAFRNFTGLTDGVYVYNLTANNSLGNRVASLSENTTLDTWTSIAFVDPTPSSGNDVDLDLIVNATVVESKVVEIGMSWFDGIKRYNTTMLDNNLMQMVSFNGEINDHSLYNNSVSKHDYYAGKPINAWVNTSYVGGKYGSGIGLTTSESIVHFGRVFSQRMSFTEAFWLKRGNDLPQTVAVDCPLVITGYENNRLRIHVQNMQDYGLTVNTPTAGNWYYVAITFNKDNNETKVFINGNLTGYVAAWDSNYPMVWGQDCRFSGGVNYWESPMGGAMDEWRVWNRSLSPDDIVQFYRTNLKYAGHDNVKWNNRSTWYITRVQNDLMPANYTYSMYDVDGGGNINNTGVRWYNILDALPPVLIYSYPSYGVDSFRRTSILVNVTTDEGHLKNISVYLYNGSGLLQKNDVAVSPNFVNFSGLADGVYLINATAWDTYNNKGYLTTRQVVLDNIVPVVGFVYPTTENSTDRGSANIFANVTSGDLNRNKIVLRLYSSYGLSRVVNSSNGASVLYHNFTGLANGWYYMNASANDTVGNVAYTGTRAFYINVNITERVSFGYTMPEIGCSFGSGCKDLGCVVCEYPSFNTSKFQQYNVSPMGQNMSLPFYNITNNGTVAINITMLLNQTSYPGVKFKVSTTRSGGIEYVCSQTYTPSVGCMYVVDTNVHVFAVNLTPGASVQGWLYSDFIGVLGGTFVNRNISINATRFQNP